MNKEEIIEMLREQQGAIEDLKNFYGDRIEAGRKREEAMMKTIESLLFRTWVGLEKSDMPDGEDPMFDHKYFYAGMVFAAKVLKDKNT